MEDARVTPADLTEVILVGGSTRIPAVREVTRLYRLFNIPLPLYLLCVFAHTNTLYKRSAGTNIHEYRTHMAHALR